MPPPLGLIDAVARMRAAQKAYFKSRLTDDLAASKAAEVEVDRLLVKLKADDDFAALARRVRVKQIEYFRTRHPRTLGEARDLEARVDAKLVELKGGGTPSLFSGPDGAA